MMMSQNPENMQKMIEENETLKKKLFELTVKLTNVEAVKTLELQNMNTRFGSISPTQKKVEENPTFKEKIAEFTRRGVEHGGGGGPVICDPLYQNSMWES